MDDIAIDDNFQALLAGCLNAVGGVGLICFNRADGLRGAALGVVPAHLDHMPDFATFCCALGQPADTTGAVSVRYADRNLRVAIAHGDAEIMALIVDGTDQAEREAALRDLALHDPLTGLLNRRGIELKMQQIATKPPSKGHIRFVAVLDIDNLKPINDRLGHKAGDEVLTAVGQLISRNLRPHDALARWGGDEFALVLPDLPLERATDICETIGVSAMEETGTTVSIGATYSYRAALDFDALVTLADEQLLLSKAAGKATISFVSADEARA